MNNQKDYITLRDEKGQTLRVELIASFEFRNKSYVIFTKNEYVQEGLVKLYISEKVNGSLKNIEPDDWSNIKIILRDIIKGANTNG